MSTLVLDTDIASLSIKDQLPSRLQDRLNASLTCVTFVTIGELTRWARLHSWGPRAGLLGPRRARRPAEDRSEARTAGRAASARGRTPRLTKWRKSSPGAIHGLSDSA
jgi:hypothetical protein